MILSCCCFLFIPRSSSSKVKKTKRKVMYSWLLGILKRNETLPTNGKKQSNFNNKSKNDTDESIFLVVRSEHQHQQQRQNEWMDTVIDWVERENVTKIILHLSRLFWNLKLTIHPPTWLYYYYLNTQKREAKKVETHSYRTVFNRIKQQQQQQQLTKRSDRYWRIN